MATYKLTLEPPVDPPLAVLVLSAVRERMSSFELQNQASSKSLRLRDRESKIDEALIEMENSEVRVRSQKEEESLVIELKRHKLQAHAPTYTTLIDPP